MAGLAVASTARATIGTLMAPATSDPRGMAPQLATVDAVVTRCRGHARGHDGDVPHGTHQHDDREEESYRHEPSPTGLVALGQAAPP
jgi:hypothetical protein